MTIDEINAGHFEAGKNLTRGSRVSSDALLEELLNQVKVDVQALEVGSPLLTVLYVDKASTASTENGSQRSPFKTIQGALSAVNSATIIMIMGVGVYDEALVYNGNHSIHMIAASGLIGSRGVQIDSVGLGVPALTITNATLSSLSAYRASGTYSDLTNKGSAGCQTFVTKHISFRGDADRNCIELLGVKGDVDPSTTGFLLTAGFLAGFCGVSSRGAAYKGIYAKNAYSVQMNNCSGNGIVEIYNIAFFGTRRVLEARGFVCEYDATSPDGEPQYGYNGTKLYRSSYNDITVNQGITLKPIRVNTEDIIINGTGAIDATDLYVDGNLDVNGASGNVSALGITISGDLTMTVGKTATLNAPHIAGDVTLDNGAGVVVLNGGEYMGALTDVGGRLTRNVGS